MAELRVGFHVSISGSPEDVVRRAEDLNCTTIQVFTHNPRSWHFKDLDREWNSEFRKLCEEEEIQPVYSHCNYLINLANPDDEALQKSIDCFRKELLYAKEFGCEYFVLHVGKHKGRGEEYGVERVAENINKCKDTILKHEVKVLLETVAGQGTEVGVEFKTLEKIIKLVDDEIKEYLGICLDTCHVFAAGHNLKTEEGVEKTFEAIENTFGIEKLELIHVNDAKGELGGNLDRHANIGEGKIGAEELGYFLTRPEIKDIPKVMETPRSRKNIEEKDMRVLRESINKNLDG